MIYLVFPGTNIMVPRYSFPLWMLHRLCTILGPDVAPKTFSIVENRWSLIIFKSTTEVTPTPMEEREAQISHRSGYFTSFSMLIVHTQTC